MKKLLFLNFFFLIACTKPTQTMDFEPPAIVGHWQTESIQHPGWEYTFDESGALCQSETGGANPVDCGFEWVQSADSVKITGEFSRLWLIDPDTDTSIVVWVINGNGYFMNHMRLIKR